MLLCPEATKNPYHFTVCTSTRPGVQKSWKKKNEHKVRQADDFEGNESLSYYKKMNDLWLAPNDEKKCYNSDLKKAYRKIRNNMDLIFAFLIGFFLMLLWCKSCSKKHIYLRGENEDWLSVDEYPIPEDAYYFHVYVPTRFKKVAFCYGPGPNYNSKGEPIDNCGNKIVKWLPAPQEPEA